MNEDYIPQRLDITSQPGWPSTFWQSKTGKWYRTKKEAIKDDGKAVDPNGYIVEKSFWKQNKNTIIVCVAVAILLAALMWCWRAGVITFKVYKQSIPLVNNGTAS